MKFTLLTLASTLSSTLAALVAGGIAANTATCSYTQRSENNMGNFGHFEVHIGRDFIKGKGCAAIKDTIFKHTGSISGYKCTNDGAGQTMLEFSTGSDRFTNYAAIEALQEAYPMVPFQKERICLMSGAPVPESWFMPDLSQLGFFSSSQ